MKPTTEEEQTIVSELEKFPYKIISGDNGYEIHQMDEEHGTSSMIHSTGGNYEAACHYIEMLFGELQEDPEGQQ